MSAYVVDREHIRYLVNAMQSLTDRYSRKARWFHNGIWHEMERVGDRKRAAEVGQMLWDANIKSVCHRYPDCSLDANTPPGPIGETYLYNKHVPLVDYPDPVQVIKACHCYEHQSCESDDWPESEACAFIRHLEGLAVRHLRGYDEAVWGAPFLHMEDTDNA